MKLPHRYAQIPGWFDFQDVYLRAIERTPHGGRVCEVGTFFGRSLSFLATEIINSGKFIELHSVDRTDVVGNREREEHPEIPHATFDLFEGCKLADILDMYLSPCLAGGGLFWVHRALSSMEASACYENESLDFVFIDASHDFASVLADLRAWWPKVKPGGTLAGHDHTHHFPGVEQACHEVFGVMYNVMGSCWVKDKDQ
jgi:hypothetical protein